MTLSAALAHWRAVDRSPLRRAIVPPCDALGDTTYDVMLAVVFRDIADKDTVTESILRIQVAIDVNIPMVTFCRDRGEPESAARIEAVIAVLEKWSNELMDAVPEPDVGRALTFADIAEAAVDASAQDRVEGHRRRA